MTTRSVGESGCGLWSLVVSIGAPASDRSVDLPSSLVLGAARCLAACRVNCHCLGTSVRLPGGSCFLPGDVWPWLRAELFQHQPSSTQSLGTARAQAQSGVLAPQNLDPRVADVVMSHFEPFFFGL